MRRDVQPIRPDYAVELRGFLKGRDPSAPVFNMPHPCSVVRILRADLGAARKEWIVDARTDADRAGRERSSFLRYEYKAGRMLDFQAFRHTFITNLARGGVHPKDVQVLARHSTITLTMDRYTHTGRGAVAGALDALPKLSGPERGVMRATCTDDAKATQASGKGSVTYMCRKTVRHRVKWSATGRIVGQGMASTKDEKPSGCNSTSVQRHF